ncbi:MAG: RNA methyltransferase [Clostridia bacterium]|nr:RNA methyltransferase [Clostridia bacterium]
MQRISSKDNSLIKHIKRLKEKKYRDEYGEFIVEGLKVINEAIQENADIKHIVVCDGCDNSEMIESHLKYEMARLDFIYVPQNIFKIISDVENPQGVLAVIGKIKNDNSPKKDEIDGAEVFSKKEGNKEVEASNKRDNRKEAEQTSRISNININEDIILALDDIQDPGNLGTILRTADSVGLKQILVSKGTADSYNPKVVRSTMGAIFRVNVIECDNLKETLKELQSKDYKVMTTSLKAKKSIYEVDYKKKIIVIGNEANGVSKEILNMADEKIIIPMLGKTESLNASVATGVILYEYVRQKIN